MQGFLCLYRVLGHAKRIPVRLGDMQPAAQVMYESPCAGHCQGMEA